MGLTLIQAAETNRKFKRPHWDCWGIEIKGNDNDAAYILTEDNEKILINVENLLANDYILEPEWYEGNFKEKYPNGVLCWVIDYEQHEYMARISDCISDENGSTKFIELDKNGNIIGRYEIVTLIDSDELPFTKKEVNEISWIIMKRKKGDINDSL